MRRQAPRRWRATSLLPLLQEQEEFGRAEHERRAAAAADEDRPFITTATFGERGWLLRSGAARAVESYARPAELEHDLTTLWDIDDRGARALLTTLPDTYLDMPDPEGRPTVRDVLETVVRHPDVVRAFGYLVGPHRDDECIGLRGVTIADPWLETFRPDVALADDGAAHLARVPGLADEHRAEWESEREMCVISSVARQQWYAARHRYGLRTAARWPREIEPLFGGLGGRGGVLLRWK